MGRDVTCRELTDTLMEYLEGTLPVERIERIEAHLAGCETCSAYLDAYREAKRLVREAEETERSTQIPEELVQAILEARKGNSGA